LVVAVVGVQSGFELVPVDMSDMFEAGLPAAVIAPPVSSDVDV
jgi:hypothetical protein